MRQGAKAYFAANLTAQVFALIRFTLLARILGPHELGLAAMILLTSQFFQNVTDTGSDRFLVQDKDGDTPLMQGMVQLILVGRGVLLAVAMVLFAGVVASIFHESKVQPYLIGLAIAPLIGGFVHLDYLRVQRNSDFRPESAIILVSETLGLAGTMAAAFITRDASAVVYGLAIRAAAMVAVSHLTAKRKYGWAFAREESLRFSKFGVPLMLNGLLIFFGSQGDRVIVANGLGTAALGHYSAIVLLIFNPVSMMMRLALSFYLPQVVRSRETPEGYEAERDRLGGRVLLVSILVLAGFVVVAPIATPLLYGKSFTEPLLFFGLIGALQTAKFMRIWPSILATSIGRSTIILANNIARIVGLPIAMAANWYSPSLGAIVGGFFVGEILALLTSLSLLHRADAVDMRREIVRVGAFLLWSGVIVGWAWALPSHQPAIMLGLAVASVTAIALLATERRVIGESIVLLRNRLRARRRA